MTRFLDGPVIERFNPDLHPSCMHPSAPVQDGEHTELKEPMKYNGLSYEEWREQGSLPLTIGNRLHEAVRCMSEQKATNENVKISANRLAKASAAALAKK